MRCVFCGRIIYPGHGSKVEENLVCEWCIAANTFRFHTAEKCDLCGEYVLEAFAPYQTNTICPKCVEKGRF